VVTGWREIAPRSAVRALELIKRKDWSSVYLLHVATPDRVVVAKEWRSPEPAFEVAVYRDVLGQLPVRTPACYGVAELAGEARTILYLEHVRRSPYCPDQPSHTDAIGRWLAELHIAAGSFDRSRAALPEQTVASMRALSTETALAIDRTLKEGEPAAPYREALHDCRAALEQLEHEWAWLAEIERRLPATLVHGDLADKNIHMHRTRGGLVPLVLDWEHCGWGAPIIDLGALAEEGRASLAPGRAYLGRIRAAWGDELAELPLFEAGRLLRIL
jgi:Phosphotransferase enzyme family